MANDETESRASRWRKAFVGPLPPDFLRITPTQDVQQAGDGQAVVACSQPPRYLVPNIIGHLNITCIQARLVRNYGLTHMDPYLRVRIGHHVYETQTDPNGGKYPHWNRVIQSQLPVGVNSIYVEIYDECNFKMDELIAWCEIKIPEKVINGESHEDWYSLSGKQGKNLEGNINIVLQLQQIPAANKKLMVPPGQSAPIPVVPPKQSQSNTASVTIPQLTEVDLKQIHEMFPNIDKEVVKTVFEVNHGNKDATITYLLQMNA